MELQQIQPKNKIIPHKIPGTPREIIGTDWLALNNNYFLCVAGYQSKFPIFKWIEGLLEEHLFKC